MSNVDLKIKLQTGTSQLMESDKKMKTICEAWTSEREKLYGQIQRQEIDLKEANPETGWPRNPKRDAYMQQLEDATEIAKDAITDGWETAD